MIFSKALPKKQITVVTGIESVVPDFFESTQITYLNDETNCTANIQYPKSITGAVGEIVGSTAIICGGVDTNNKITSTCFAFNR